jgi:hypothetical protein
VHIHLPVFGAVRVHPRIATQFHEIEGIHDAQRVDIIGIGEIERGRHIRYYPFVLFDLATFQRDHVAI